MESIDQLTLSAQRRLLELSSDIERVDGALRQVIDSLDGAQGALPREVASAADAVRRDLLADATETLRLLAHSSDAGARARQLSAFGARERLLGGML